ncbi:MAG TPA: hypothetical protein VNW71_05000 [Thermoanaerobaculia bacterium]|nr:hypothetical protein [Thermoanaerobaculia bacterium]
MGTTNAFFEGYHDPLLGAHVDHGTPAPAVGSLDQSRDRRVVERRTLPAVGRAVLGDDLDVVRALGEPAVHPGLRLLRA